MGDQGATVVHIEPAVRAVTVVTQLGSVLPLLSSSTGLVFSAYLPHRETDELRVLETAIADHPLADEKTTSACVNRSVNAVCIMCTVC